MLKNKPEMSKPKSATRSGKNHPGIRISPKSSGPIKHETYITKPTNRSGINSETDHLERS